MHFLSNFGSKITFMCSVNIIIVISKIPTNYLKETLVMWPLSASGLLCYQSVSQSVIQLLNQSFHQPVSQLQVDNQPVPKLLSQSVKMVSWLVRSILSKLVNQTVNQSVGQTVTLWNFKPNSSVYLVYLRAGLKHKTYSTYITEDNRGSWLMKVLVQSFCGIWSENKSLKYSVKLVCYFQNRLISR